MSKSYITKIRSKLIPSTPVPESSSSLPIDNNLGSVFCILLKYSVHILVIPYVLLPLFGTNNMKEPCCFYLVNSVIAPFGNHSFFSTAVEYSFVRTDPNFFSLPWWASRLLLIYCNHNSDSMNNLNISIRLLVSFPLETLSALDFHDTVLSYLSRDFSGWTCSVSFASASSATLFFECQILVACSRVLSSLSALPSWVF